MEPFINNEQLNFIKNQVALINDSMKKNVPAKVLAAVVDVANSKIHSLFPSASLEQQSMLNLSKLKTDKEFDRYIEQLSACLLAFPTVQEQELKKMFPKQKKLKLPDLSKIDYSRLTYLSWNDLRSNKKFIVYELDGKLVGIEGRFIPTNKKNLCSFCNCFGEISYFSTITKAKKSKNPDYYKAIGNFVCTDSMVCNQKITSTEYLTAFLHESLRA
ncbi:FusB/FusC family EF-G-binding protein [Bacillus sp. Au-Bac7]|uniref:FusB/FusC family EF-G-binding protein n=1 Tax=Bacillus sp. Au-Bac7 TaxID=2906458 RepID=UPI001E37659D|nr:FusB/FusC family EF-G-binding protein [Bacillus sp. Au-Bac7]MCE4051137.1 FusB/FusC family EF-G-binding protein [Bacillus sp. Au-Bac7]